MLEVSIFVGFDFVAEVAQSGGDKPELERSFATKERVGESGSKLGFRVLARLASSINAARRQIYSLASSATERSLLVERIL